MENNSLADDQLTKIFSRLAIFVETTVYTSIPIEYPARPAEQGLMYVVDTSTWPIALKEK